MKIVILTLGCKVNQYESEAIAEVLTKMGYEISRNLEVADAYVLNTCAVTNAAERKSRQTISKFTRVNPNGKIFICGCASQKNSVQFEKFQNVAFICGTANKLKLVEKIDEIFGDRLKIENQQKHEKYINLSKKDENSLKNSENSLKNSENLLNNINEFQKISNKKLDNIILKNKSFKKNNKKNQSFSYADEKKKISEIEEIPDFYEDISISNSFNTRAFVKIQDGCNKFCSYCIIPYLRGRSRSRDIVSILNEVGRLTKNGIKEIVLAGIDISDYRIDGKPALIELLNQLSKHQVRLRLSSFEVGIITTDFLKQLSKISNFCPHFHISLQSGCDGVLKRMNRRYTQKEFFQAVKKIRKQFKNCAITTDIIVGFPGETEVEFQKTLKFINKIKFSRTHIFPYSRRSGTVADTILNSKTRKDFAIVKADLIKERAKILREIDKEHSEKFMQKQIGSFHEIIVEEKIDEFYVGHSKNYLKVYLKDISKNQENLANEILTVKILSLFKDGVLGDCS